MAGSTYTAMYVKYINYWLKKGAGMDAILEGVGISAPLTGALCKLGMWVSNGPVAARLYVQWLGLHIELYVFITQKIGYKNAPERPPYWKALELARRLWGAI